MNWVARAKETLLGVSPPHMVPDERSGLATIQWDSLPTLRTAISESLTGSPDTHPAAQTFSEIAAVQRYLIVTDATAEAQQIAASITPLAADAQATVLSFDRDRPDIEQRIASKQLGEDFDVIFACLASDAELDLETLFGWLNATLSETGLLWLNLRPATISESIASAHLTELLDEILQQVPSRWRLKQRFDGKATPASVGVGHVEQEAVTALHAKFNIISRRNRGGALLRRLFADGCIAPEMDEDTEGQKLLLALYQAEKEIVETGEVTDWDSIYLARPRRHHGERIRQLFERHAGPPPEGATAGMSGPLPEWIKFNLTSALQSARAADFAAPFPPTDLMYHTTGLAQNRDFAQHGADILKALSAASPRPLNTLESVLDFGVGVGRVGRYFKGFSGRYVGVDIDEANLGWVADKLPWIEAVHTEPEAPLPFEAAIFDGVISISVFTHIDRSTTEFYIDELHRVTRPGALLFLTLHGEKALARALLEESVGRLIGIPSERLEQAKLSLAQDGFDFAEQYTHLTRRNYRYGTTFVSQPGAEAMFGRRFRVHRFVSGAIHAFQDLVVLEHP